MIPRYAKRENLDPPLTHLRQNVTYRLHPLASPVSEGTIISPKVADLRHRDAAFQSPSCALFLLHRVGSAARSHRAKLALFELEGEHIEQAIDPIRQRLEQGLFLDWTYVEMEAKEVD
jgi:hypothetical protein